VNLFLRRDSDMVAARNARNGMRYLIAQAIGREIISSKRHQAIYGDVVVLVEDDSVEITPLPERLSLTSIAHIISNNQ